MTTQTQLDQINAAITAIETGGQEYTIGNRKLRRADLTVLYQERRQLQQQLSAETEQGFGYITNVAKFAGR